MKSLGFLIDDRRGKGSHALVYHPDDKSRITTIPRADPVRTGTLKGMLEELQIDPKDFEHALGR